MKDLKSVILEKLHISKDSEFEPDEISKVFQNEDALEIIKFILNCIKRSKPNESYFDSIFYYWDMHIKNNQLHCMHLGWSSSKQGYAKSRYLDRCVWNYNHDNSTNIKVEKSGWDFKPGISILKIKEVVDALKDKYKDFKVEDESKLVSVL